MIYVVGDVMLDKYTYGGVQRISPEAPIPILKIEKSEYKLGGAANVANNLKPFSRVMLLGVLGKDENAKHVEKLLRNAGITFYFEKNKKKTTLKERLLSMEYSQQLLRLDLEDSSPINPKTAKNLVSKIPRNSYVIISDYRKGVVTKELLSFLTSKNCKIFVDGKPENLSFYKNLFVLKFNYKEACRALNTDITNKLSELKKLAKKLSIIANSNIIITRAAEGSLGMFGSKLYVTKPQKVEVADVTGAGDTFIAFLALSFKKGKNINKSLEIANLAASKVVSKPGTAILSKKEIKI